MRIGTNKGHTLKGQGTGAVGCGKKEQDLTREVGRDLDELLKKEGNTIIDCTVDSATSSSAALKAIVQKANGSKIELLISIHFNASNGKGNGVEIFVYDFKDTTKPIADRICKNFEKLGYKNRGVKLSKNAPQGGLSVVDNTNMPALLIECCFIDNTEDMKKYNPYKFAKAIAEGVLNKSIENSTTGLLSKSFKSGDYKGKKAKATADGLRVRYDRGTNHKELTKVNKGHIFELEYCLNGWVSVKGYKGNKGLGYVSTDYLELI